MTGPALLRNDKHEETHDGLDSPEAARNLHRHGNQRLLRRDAVADRDGVFTIGAPRRRISAVGLRVSSGWPTSRGGRRAVRPALLRPKLTWPRVACIRDVVPDAADAQQRLTE